MSVIIIKPLAQESQCNTAANSTFANSNLVRIVNLGAAAALVSTLYPNTSVIGSFSMIGNTEIIVQKNKTDILVANNNNVYGTPIAFTNQ
jgi:hypothetical protein